MVGLGDSTHPTNPPAAHPIPRRITRTATTRVDLASFGNGAATPDRCSVIGLAREQETDGERRLGTFPARDYRSRGGADRCLAVPGQDFPRGYHSSIGVTRADRA